MPPVPVEFHPEAIEEARAARDWYAERDPAVAVRFLAELDRAVAIISDNPERWPIHHHGMHRYLLRRFPYSLVYRFEQGCLRVIACQHARRRPGYWRGRGGT